MIFFDLDNTLLDEETARRNHLPKFFDLYSHLSSYSFSEFAEKWTGSLELYYRMFLDGKLSLEEQRIRRIEYSFGLTDVSKTALEDMGRTYTMLNEQSWVAFPQWRPFLEKSPSKKAIVTNGSSEQQRRKLRLLDLERYFETIFISEEVGYAKPSMELLDLIMVRTRQRPQDCIFVGDSLENDVIPSLEIGTKTIWINHAGRPSGIANMNLIEVATVEAAVKELEKLNV